MPDTIEELNRIELSKADSLAEHKNYEGALKIYAQVLDRTHSKESQQLIMDRVSMIKKSMYAPEPVQKEKEKPKKASTIEFKVYKNRFKDVIGLRRQKEILYKHLSLPLKHMEMFHKLNLKPSVGIVLYGPAGVGKTALLKAVSGELNLPMADIHLSEIMSKFVGESEKRLKETFDAAKIQQPCIVFFDEIDALGASRDSIENEGAGTEKKGVITEFLKQVSEVHDDANAKIFLVGATNQPWAMDAALKRSGRFEFLLYVRPPTFIERKKLLKMYLNVNLEYLGHTDWNLLSLAMNNYSPADIEKIAKLAKLSIIESGKGKVTTRLIQRILKDKDEGTSSLDNWYHTTYSAYVKRPKYQKMGGKEKVLIERGGKFDKEEMIMYKEMVNDVRRFEFYYNWIRVVRFFARGI